MVTIAERKWDEVAREERFTMGRTNLSVTGIVEEGPGVNQALILRMKGRAEDCGRAAKAVFDTAKQRINRNSIEVAIIDDSKDYLEFKGKPIGGGEVEFRFEILDRMGMGDGVCNPQELIPIAKEVLQGLGLEQKGRASGLHA